MLRDAFDERLAEVDAYLDFLASMEIQARTGAPRFEDAEEAITPQQQKLLYASVYLQLYNLVEATVTLCMEAVAAATREDSRWLPRDLSVELRREWIRSTARTHKDLNYSNRLIAAMTVANHLFESHPVGKFEIEKGGGGNWDDHEIEAMSARLGCGLVISKDVRTSVKRPIKDDLGALGLVKSRRNSLAHGEMSFTESAEEVTVTELKSLADAVVGYLKEVVSRFAAYVEGHEYLIPESRPVGSP